MRERENYYLKKFNVKHLSIKRIIKMLIIPVLAMGIFSYKEMDAVTLCGPFTESVTFIQPKLTGNYRQMVINHEAKHAEQVRRYGCFKIMEMRVSKLERQRLEDEATDAELINIRW